MRALLLVGLVACSPARPPGEPSAVGTSASSAGPSLLAAIERGDLEQARVALCAAYAEHGMECAEPLRLTLLAADDVMSRYRDEDVAIAMQPMPPAGGGFAYWDHWSALLSDGAWQPRALFADDADARRVANMLLATVLAHELGHHLASVYRCSRSGPAKELLADQLAVPLLRELATGELGALHARMRTVADAMIAAVPEDVRVVVPSGVDVPTWVDGTAELPADPRAYVTLHLSRQRALLADGATFAASAGAACLEPFKRQLAGRRLLPSRVRTERRVPGGAASVAAFDADGRLYATPFVADGGAIVITPVDGGRPISVAADGFVAIDAFAAASPTRFAVATDRLILIDASTTPPATRVIEGAHPKALAFDRDGTLYAMEADDRSWKIVDVESGRVRWSGHGLTTGAWLDGPLAGAELDPLRFTIAGDALIASDGRSLRIVDHGQVSTLAGGARGLRDGDAGTARLFAVSAVRALADGTIRFVEEDGDRWVVRVLARSP